jgi:hypothetical protein
MRHDILVRSMTGNGMYPVGIAADNWPSWLRNCLVFFSPSRQDIHSNLKWGTAASLYSDLMSLSHSYGNKHKTTVKFTSSLPQQLMAGNHPHDSKNVRYRRRGTDTSVTRKGSRLLSNVDRTWLKHLFRDAETEISQPPLLPFCPFSITVVATSVIFLSATVLRRLFSSV